MSPIDTGVFKVLLRPGEDQQIQLVILESFSRATVCWRRRGNLCLGIFIIMPEIIKLTFPFSVNSSFSHLKGEPGFMCS